MEYHEKVFIYKKNNTGMSKKFILENRFNKTLHIILYSLLLLTIGTIYITMKAMGTEEPEIFTVVISILLSITIILKRENILKYMADIYLDLKIWYLRKENKQGLKKVLSNLSTTTKITHKPQPEKTEKVYTKRPTKKEYIEIK